MSKDIVFKTIMLKGEAGSSIVSFEKTATVLDTDTYTITFSDGTHASFDVENGSSIASIEKTATTGATDTYTITLTNGNETTFEVVNGESYEVPTGGVIMLDGSTAPEGYEIITNPLTGATTSLNFAKKVSNTDVKGFGEIIDSFNTGDNKTTNAPSLAAVEKRTDNNLLINSGFEDIVEAYISTDYGTIDNRFAAWQINDNPLIDFGVGGYPSYADGGLRVSTLTPSAFYISSPWYDVNNLDLDYITVSMDYKTSSGGSWTRVAKTFNASTQEPTTSNFFTANGSTVSVSPFQNGKIRINISAAPSANFYIRRVKLERGTGATPFINNPEAAICSTESIYKSLMTLDNSEYSPRYKQSITFDYFGGGYFRVNQEADADVYNYYECLFNLPLSKVFDSTPEVTVNELDINNERTVINNPVNIITKKEYKDNGGAQPYLRLTFPQSQGGIYFPSVIDNGFVSSIFANITLS